MKTIDIYTDGSCEVKTRVGGWACIFILPNGTKDYSGSEDHTTSQRMELTAVIKALNQLSEPYHVNIFSDSKYVVDSNNRGWVDQWVEDDFKLVDGEDRKNADLWRALIKASDPHNVRYIKVKGHTDNEMNKRADWLAGLARRRRLVEMGLRSEV